MEGDDKQLLGTFQDQRTNALWALSDVLLLEQVHIRYPEILPDKEWEAIKDNLEMCFNGLDHYAASPNHNYEWSEEKTAQEWGFLTGSLRWRAAKDVMRFEKEPQRILDLGTHTGAHAVELSNIFPNARVFAREIVADIVPAIEYTIQHYAQHPENLSYSIGDHRNPPLPDQLDLLYSGELLEHMLDWKEFITTIEAACKPGGQIVVTTPTGPWEQSNSRHIHVAAWSVDDLHEVFGQKQGFKTLELCNRQVNAWPMGWIITTWQAHTGPLGEINWNRKLAQWGFPVV